MATSVFGGTTQFTIKGLTDLTESPLAPAWYVSSAVAIGGIAMALTQESAPVKAAHSRQLRGETPP